MASPEKSLKRADGTAVTAQEAYDAFINTRVLIVIGGITSEAISMEWHDNNSTHTDPTNVGYVKLSYIDATQNPPVGYSVPVGVK